ncbi:MAG: hypothetical protein E5X73_36205 [Mesorhizobium sp.]|nr:MAG: hypothetical protein E5X73_36205 [Mesorhizobium sp.]
MTAAAPLARYSAVEGALASGFAIADLHHAVGHDLHSRRIGNVLGNSVRPARSQKREVASSVGESMRALTSQAVILWLGSYTGPFSICVAHPDEAIPGACCPQIRPGRKIDA